VCIIVKERVFFLFCVASPKSMKLVFDHGKGLLIFHEKARETRVVKLGHVTPSNIIWNVFGSPVVWDKNPMTISLAILYLREFGGSDFWENKLGCRNWDFSLCTNDERDQLALMQDIGSDDPDFSCTPFGWSKGWWPEVFKDFAVLSKVPRRSLCFGNNIPSGLKCNLCSEGVEWDRIYCLNGEKELPQGYSSFKCVCLKCYSDYSMLDDRNKRYSKYQLMVRQCEMCFVLKDLSHFENHDNDIVCYRCQANMIYS